MQPLLPHKRKHKQTGAVANDTMTRLGSGRVGWTRRVTQLGGAWIASGNDRARLATPVSSDATRLRGRMGARLARLNGLIALLLQSVDDA